MLDSERHYQRYDRLAEQVGGRSSHPRSAGGGGRQWRAAHGALLVPPQPVVAALRMEHMGTGLQQGIERPAHSAATVATLPHAGVSRQAACPLQRPVDTPPCSMPPNSLLLNSP